MSAPKDGGPAFPGGSISELADRGSAWGMSMRDYFAAAALQGLLANHGEEIEQLYWGLGDKESISRLAKFSYVISDAMLSKRRCGGES
jgi:hypothetical protein